MRNITKADVQLFNTFARIKGFVAYGGYLDIISGCIVFNDLGRLARHSGVYMSLNQVRMLRVWLDSRLPNYLTIKNRHDFDGLKEGDFYRDCNGVERLFTEFKTPNLLVMDHYIIG